MLKEPVLKKLNEQLNHELQSAYLYYAMAAYFESINLKGFANWMVIQAQEELSHVARFYAFINDRGARVSFAAVSEPQQDWDSAMDVMVSTYEHECQVSELINETVSLAIAENDHATNTFLQWFVAEQVEEEATADDIVQKLKLIGDNSSGLFMMDTELSKRTFVAEGGAGAGQ